MEHPSPFLRTREIAAPAAGFWRLIHEKMIEIAFLRKKVWGDLTPLKT